MIKKIILCQKSDNLLLELTLSLTCCCFLKLFTFESEVMSLNWVSLDGCLSYCVVKLSPEGLMRYHSLSSNLI